MTDLKSVLAGMATSPKTAIALGSATAASGLSTVLEWIPNDIGKLASAMGALLSFVLIIYWLVCIRIKITESRIINEKERRMLPRK